MKYSQTSAQAVLPEKLQESTSGSSLRKNKSERAAIFLDAEYFRIACFNTPSGGIIKSTQGLIEYVKGIANLQHVKRWRCYAYDAKYAGKAESAVHPAERSARKRLHVMLQEAGFTTRYGSYVLRDMKVVGNVMAVKSIVQKEVDVMIVVEAMREALAVGTDTFIFITGDSDFLPLFFQLRALEKTVVLLHGDESTVSAQLIKRASQAHKIVPERTRGAVQSQLSTASWPRSR